MNVSGRKIFRIVITIIIIGIIGGYTAYETRGFTAGPSLTITTPENGARFTDPKVTLTGETERVSHITLNGNDIFIDTTGRFEETLLLFPGYNIITVHVEDRFGRTETKKLELGYDGDPVSARSAEQATTTASSTNKTLNTNP